MADGVPVGVEVGIDVGLEVGVDVGTFSSATCMCFNRIALLTLTFSKFSS